MLFLSLSLFAVICRESSLEPLKPNSLNSPARAENGPKILRECGCWINDTKVARQDGTDVCPARGKQYSKVLAGPANPRVQDVGPPT
jgi:hypothetical protein